MPNTQRAGSAYPLFAQRQSGRRRRAVYTHAANEADVLNAFAPTVAAQGVPFNLQRVRGAFDAARAQTKEAYEFQLAREDAARRAQEEQDARIERIARLALAGKELGLTRELGLARLALQAGELRQGELDYLLRQRGQLFEEETGRKRLGFEEKREAREEEFGRKRLGFEEKREAREEEFGRKHLGLEERREAREERESLKRGEAAEREYELRKKQQEFTERRYAPETELDKARRELFNDALISGAPPPTDVDILKRAKELADLKDKFQKLISGELTIEQIEAEENARATALASAQSAQGAGATKGGLLVTDPKKRGLMPEELVRAVMDREGVTRDAAIEMLISAGILGYGG